tara:strand:- start:1544 stop:2278 length:735 start_codon:yes stop_codon:yes gene_type:complete
MSKFLYRFSAGFCMGVAEITPGISGATIAGIFNVYEPFIRVLSFFNPKKLITDFNSFFKNINLPLMMPLMFGMIVSIYLSAHFVDYLIEHQLNFFKIFLSLVMLFAVIKNCTMDQIFSDSAKYFLSFALGIIVALLVAFSLIEFNFNNDLLFILAGLLAFTAFILPGISGSLVLLILGVYQEVISNVKNLDILALLPFVMGMLLAFFIVPAQIVQRFEKNKHQTKVLFSGLIFGSIPAIWLHLN